MDPNRNGKDGKSHSAPQHIQCSEHNMTNNYTANDNNQPGCAPHYETKCGVAKAPSQMIPDIREVMILHDCLVANGYAGKASSLGLIIQHEIVRLAALTPMSPAEARLKAAFLTEKLRSKSFTLGPLAKSMIDAALAFEADLFADLSAIDH